MSRPPKEPRVFDATSIFGDRVPPEETPEQRAKRKSIEARCGHVKRRLLQHQPLKGDLLDFALGIGASAEIAEKLKAGQPLDDYELHQMVEMHLLNARLHPFD